jgi:hypothetical protein
MVFLKAPSRSYSQDVARALDPSVRASELVVLAAHRDPGVRAAVASRPDAPMASLIFLTHERDLRILSALVDNPASPPTVIRALTAERRSDIGERASARMRGAGAHGEVAF